MSIIVSLYNAASKLDHFLRLVSTQTIFTEHGAELLLIDSGSEHGESARMAAMAAALAIPFAYARTAERETIQAAWNRGLSISRAPYVAFLGVDEGLRPDALATLSAELDRRRDLDWIMADSIVTEASASGEWLGDVMMYDRREFELPLHILDCCYLSYVGGLYRKSLHERVGYYDSTFRAAGDTEFKNRALPFISAAHYPEPLGFFINYPDDRMTLHPRAEIEDLRAWYLFRAPGGLSYLTQNMSPADRLKLLRHALCYRKSFSTTLSQDLDLAASLCSSPKDLPSGAGSLAVALARAKAAIDQLDWMPRSRPQRVVNYLNARRALRELNRAYSVAFNSRREGISLFRDNRYQQHANLWGTAL